MVKLKVISVENAADGFSHSGEAWFYNDTVKEHFFNPRNIFRTTEEKESFKADGVGLVGSPACGDGMKMFIKVDRKTDTITDCRWETYGCGTAIASTSMFSEMVKGKKISEALKITPKDIADALGGIPARKFHCSVLADKALKHAVTDYFKKTGQDNRITTKPAKVIDKALGITEEDIKHAVLEGAQDFWAVQKKTKVGVHDKLCIPEVNRLIKKYKKKYFGE